MRRSRILIVMIVMGLSIVACENPTASSSTSGGTQPGDTGTAPEAPTDTESISISGKIGIELDGERYIGLPGVQVEAWGAGGKLSSTLSEADGNYTLSVPVAEGTPVSVVVSAEYSEIPDNLEGIDPADIDVDGIYAGAARSATGTTSDHDFTFLHEATYATVNGQQLIVGYLIQQGYDPSNPLRMVANIQQLQAIGSVRTPGSGPPGSGGSGSVSLGATASEEHPVEDAVEAGLLDQSFMLVRDIDASGSATWNDGEGWVPIGTDEGRFTGSVNGQNYTIRGLHIWGVDTGEPVGLFGYVEGPADIRNLRLEQVEISFPSIESTEPDTIGTVVGTAHGTAEAEVTLSNLRASGSIYAPESFIVGGLVGELKFGRIENSTATVNVTGESKVGGLLGVNLGGTVSNSQAHGSVSAEGSLGGLVGQSSNETETVEEETYIARIESSHASGTVAATGEGDSSGDRVGGLVGDKTDGTIESSTASGNVSGHSEVGGLVGVLREEGAQILNSSASGNVSGATKIGGLLGLMQRFYPGGVSASNAHGNVTPDGSVDSPAAGLLIGELLFNDGWEEVTDGEYSTKNSENAPRVVSSSGTGAVVGADPQPGPQIGNSTP